MNIGNIEVTKNLLRCDCEKKSILSKKGVFQN